MMLVPRRNNFDLFDNFFDDELFSKKDTSLMKTDIIEKDDKYVLKMDLPGFSKEDVNLSLNNGYLEVNAKVVEEDNNDEEEKYVHRERFYGECSRKFYVGDDINKENISAEFKNGILYVDIPKKEIEDRNETHQIEIK